MLLPQIRSLASLGDWPRILLLGGAEIIGAIKILRSKGRRRKPMHATGSSSSLARILSVNKHAAALMIITRLPGIVPVDILLVSGKSQVFLAFQDLPLPDPGSFLAVRCSAHHD